MTAQTMKAVELSPEDTLLLIHELGHLSVAQHHGIDVTVELHEDGGFVVTPKVTAEPPIPHLLAFMVGGALAELSVYLVHERGCDTPDKLARQLAYHVTKDTDCLRTNLAEYDWQLLDVMLPMLSTPFNFGQVAKQHAEALFEIVHYNKITLSHYQQAFLSGTVFTAVKVH